MVPETLLLGKINKQIAEIGGLVYHDCVEIADVALAETADHLAWSEATGLQYVPVRDGHCWGAPWATGWFRLRIARPSGWAGVPMALHFQPGGEAMIYVDGQPYHGLDHRRTVCLLPADLDAEEFELYVEALAGDTSEEERAWGPRIMRQPSLSRYQASVWELWQDLLALAELIPHLPEQDVWRAKLTHGLSEAVDLFNYSDTSAGGLAGSVQRISEHLRPLYECHASGSAPTAACLANAHIDLAWRWPLRETPRKSARTFANVLRLQERYPELRFHQSQVFLYESVKQQYPHLYEQIRQRHREGRICPVGAMYVEPDCNLPSGESLVRQILYGTRFFEQEFGDASRVMWLPDTFGFPASLPQLIRRSGMKWFFTHKLAWNNITVFPHHSFVWEGLDGTQILSHCTPSNSYNSELDAQHLRFSLREYRQKGCSGSFLIPFGRGDGGGGPTAAMLERLRRYADLEGLPKLQPMTPEVFFERLEKDRPCLPLWRGELYLERHRGVFTSQAELKRLNRRIESLLHDVECLAGIAGTDYPDRALDELWRELLLHQFHDVLSGCAISEANADAERRLNAAQSRLDSLRRQAVESLAAKLDTRGQGQPVVVVNTLGWTRSEVVTIEAGPSAVVDQMGREVASQAADHGTRLRFRAEAPPFGQAVYFVRARTTSAAEVAAPVMENACLRVEFDPQGRMVSIVDKRVERQLLAPGAVGNQFQLFLDKAAQYDAWEIEPWVRHRMLQVDGQLISSEFVETGPLRTVLRQIRGISNSRIVQDIVLDADSPLLRFETVVEWNQERHCLLKVAFPLDLLTDRATYEIPFGHVQRPTHTNTPFDAAQFEVPAQKWADLSEPDFGVALLNDSRYGYDALGGTLRLSLLRATTYPDPRADIQRVHRLTYALLPHGPGLAEVVRGGYALNQPLLTTLADAHGGSPAWSPLRVEAANVIIETIKRGEDGNGLIVRLYEAHGCRGLRRLHVQGDIAEIWETDLLERDERLLASRQRELSLDFRPFEIRTLRVRFATGN